MAADNLLHLGVDLKKLFYIVVMYLIIKKASANSVLAKSPFLNPKLS